MKLEISNRHFPGKQECNRTGTQPYEQQETAEKFQYSCNSNLRKQLRRFPIRGHTDWVSE